MADRYFTPDEVEALIPRLSAAMDGLMAAHAEATELRDRLRRDQERIALAGGGVIDQTAWRRDREQLERLTTRVQKGLDEIVSLGGVPKDLGLGLVDFPHLRAGEEVNLCWKHGEREIRYWHGLDEGYTSRKLL